MTAESSPASAKRVSAQRRMDELMERASQALAAMAWEEAEVAASEALELAHRQHDYERMARILLPLQEARRQRRLQALDEQVVVLLEDPMPVEEAALEPGCWLVCPPFVGMDAVQLRERSLKERVPMLVVAREPTTRAGAWPLVAVGPRVFRVKAKPPRSLTPGWFVDAVEALAEEAINAVDPALPAWERVDDLMDALLAVPESERAHQALEQACQEAARGGEEGQTAL